MGVEIFADGDGFKAFVYIASAFVVAVGLVLVGMGTGFQIAGPVRRTWSECD